MGFGVRWIDRIGLAVAIGLAAPVRAGVVPDRSRGREVLVVYNEREPASRDLAEYYARARGVPADRILPIRVRAAETITRPEFNEGIQDPILHYLVRRGWLRPRMVMTPNALLGIPMPQAVYENRGISYVVLMYGVPLRIDHDWAAARQSPVSQLPAQLRRDEASVDSELAVLPTVGMPIIGPLTNPIFGHRAGSYGVPYNRQVLLVGRLDGPDPATVRRMIDDALEAEYYGLHGRAYFDGRGIQSGGYAVGDEWIRNAYLILRHQGFECELEHRPELFDADYPMTDVAVYAGWYARNCQGPFRRSDFRFRPGAVAYHLHSLSAASVRSRNNYWVGPLLARGAAVTMGNVFEPYLAMTPRIDMFFQRLTEGCAFLEAAYYSQPALSWQTTFVGDPLYRPFGTPLDQQIARMNLDQKPDVDLAYERKINLMLGQLQTDEAERLCRVKAESLHSAVLYEKLGDLMNSLARGEEAVAAYDQALKLSRDRSRNLRLTVKLAEAYDKDGQKALALRVYEYLALANAHTQNALELFGRARDTARSLGDVDRARLWQGRIEQWQRSHPRK